MKIRLKHLADQVMVITGASSGIGLVTARKAARRGARLVLVARNAQALQQLTDELTAAGHTAIHVVADVSRETDMQQVARAAIDRFGGFDTWINNASVTIFGRSTDVSLDDQRRLFDINFWGVVHGSLIAAEHLKRRGGALINIGSEASDHALPLQGIYSASKHAVRGFTDALRVELEQERAPVSVTLIKPGPIDTMFVPHASNYMEVEARLPSPAYAPEVVADAILFAAQHPRRDIYVGASAKLGSAAAHYTPRLLDRYLSRILYHQQRSPRPAGGHRTGTLYSPGTDMRERHGHQGLVLESSWYTKAATHPTATGLALASAGLALAALWRRSVRERR